MFKKRLVDLTEKKIVWEWYERGRYYSWGDVKSLEIEKHYNDYKKKNGSKTVSMKANNNQNYRINFQNMNQENTYSYYTRQLRRREEKSTSRKVNVAKLDKLWDKYYNDDIEGMGGEEIMQFCDDLGIDPYDIDLLVLFYKLGATKKYFLDNDQFIMGLAKLGMETSDKIKSKSKTLKNQISGKDDFFKFYMWLFTYFKEDLARTITSEVASQTWKLVFKGKYKFIDDWCNYYENEHKKAVTKDTWKMFYDFTRDKTFNSKKSFSEYDLGMSVWPTAIDEFIEFMAKK